MKERESEKRPGLFTRIIAAIKGETIEEITLMDVSNVPTKECFLVRQINEESESMAEALGIGEERFQELQKICHAAYVTTHKLSAALAMASESVKHANELVMVGYLLGDIRHKSNHPLAAILGGMRRDH